jgi:hypothetical protein
MIWKLLELTKECKNNEAKTLALRRKEIARESRIGPRGRPRSPNPAESPVAEIPNNTDRSHFQQ